TRGFWKDPQRYIETYWSRFPDLWVHGDFAVIDEDGMYFILGRSDDTIKVAGKRLGPAEVENLLVGHPAVAEAAAIGVPDEIKGQAVVAFVVLQSDSKATESLRTELELRVAIELGKPLAPKEIRFVGDIPKTRNAKVMRRLIRSAYLGEEPGDLGALVNPDAVEEIRQAS
ncbi:MAG: AMP-binding protein, partial [Anaerolineales bacterium]|nr:AMP-binding protein [Anaerolineales bacterium]